MAASPQAGGGSMSEMALMFAIIFMIFWFIVIRPQKKQEKTRKDMLSSLKKGDQVVTQGGIIGKIVSIKENRIVLKIDENSNSKATFLQHAIVSVIEKKNSKEKS